MGRRSSSISSNAGTLRARAAVSTPRMRVRPRCSRVNAPSVPGSAPIGHSTTRSRTVNAGNMSDQTNQVPPSAPTVVSVRIKRRVCASIWPRFGAGSSVSPSSACARSRRCRNERVRRLTSTQRDTMPSYTTTSSVASHRVSRALVASSAAAYSIASRPAPHRPDRAAPVPRRRTTRYAGAPASRPGSPRATRRTRLARDAARGPGTRRSQSAKR